MTEGPVKHEKPMCVRIWLEVGHACEPRRSSSGRALALDWRVWVRGIGGQDISGFVHKVVFLLHPPEAFVYPKRVLQEPPYEIQESGCVSLMIPIEVYLKYSTKPKKIVLRYNLHIENDLKSSSESTCVYYDFKNPSAQLLQELMRGGAEAMRSPGSRGDKLVVILPDDKDKCKDSNGSRKRKYYFVEPIKCEHGSKKGTKSYILEDICSKCGESFKINFKRLLASASMSDGEIGRITRLYSSFSSYENSVDALPLPPLTDAIYKLPSLPYSLRGALTTPAVDHVLQ